jgi:hypothetical protein
VVLRCDTGEGGSALEVRFEVPQKVTMKISVFCDIHRVASAVQVGAIHLLQIWISRLRNCKILKINMLIVLLKKCINQLHPCVAAFGQPLLDTTHFQKCMYM